MTLTMAMLIVCCITLGFGLGKHYTEIKCSKMLNTMKLKGWLKIPEASNEEDY